MSWLKEFVNDETYARVSDKMRNIYDTIHPPNLVILLDTYEPVHYDLNLGICI